LIATAQPTRTAIVEFRPCGQIGNSEQYGSYIPQQLRLRPATLEVFPIQNPGRKAWAGPLVRGTPPAAAPPVGGQHRCLISNPRHLLPLSATTADEYFCPPAVSGKHTLLLLLLLLLLLASSPFRLQ
jgi:hypothetical protein